MEYYKHYTVLKETLKLIEQYRESPGINQFDERIEDIIFYNENRFQLELTEVFDKEYLLYYNKYYFFGCSFEVYKKTYNERLKEFQQTFFDATEIDFIESELNEGVFYPKIQRKKSDFAIDEVFNINSHYTKQIQYSLKKRFEYLQQRAEENKFSLSYYYSTDFPDVASYNLEPIQELLNVKTESINDMLDILEPLNWNGTELQLTELTKALIQSNLINKELTQKDIFKRLKMFFQIDDFNENDKLKDIRKRTKDKTRLINILETSLTTWITNKD